MKNHLRISISLIVITFVFFTKNITAQNNGVNYNLYFPQGQKWVPENMDDYFKNVQVHPDEIVKGKYYRLLQFFEIPTIDERADMERLGIEFLDYYPSRAYLVAIPSSLQKSKLKNRGARAIIPLNSEVKKDKNLIDIDGGHASVHGDEADILLRFHRNIDMDWVENEIRKTNVINYYPMAESKTMSVRIHLNDLENFVSLPYVSYLALMPEKGEPEDRRGGSLHRSNAIDTEYASGRHYNGEGVGVLVRDDGLVGPHIDFKGREFQDVSGDGASNHSDGVAGIFAGAGNLNPDIKGMAAGADMHVINYAEDFNQNLISLSLHQNEDVLVVNSSYSNGCNAGYTMITETVDQHIFDNPTFLHVFSAGNSNGNDCDYGAGNQWGNITGGHKQGKNVMTTANVFENASLANSSSRGPGHDGRIKPDITANGQGHLSTDPFNQYKSFGGTSGAAPAVAGVAAQLHHAYRDLNGGVTATSALIKGAIMNTANDLGTPGPDFRFGWGHLNAYRAFRLLEDVRYEAATITQDQNNTHTLSVPANTVQVRIMVYWNETPAVAGTTKALVNDLDMIVTSPSGTTKLPWVLDEFPDPNTLALPATNGEDHLNNVEQVLFDNPEAGDYIIDVNGFEVPFGVQEYYILYEVVTDEITVTYPIGGEGFVPNQEERLRWDAYGNNGNFTVDYTTDDGASWQNITTTNGDERMFLWNVPNEISGEVRVRVSRDNSMDESDANLSICRVPFNLQVEQFCPNFMRVSWSAVANATGYDVFYLGEKFMDSVGTTNALEFDIPLPMPLGDHWFSVRAVGNNGLRGKRANAVLYNDGLLDCILENDVATTQLFSPLATNLVSCDPLQNTISIEVENTSINDQPSLSFGYQINNEPPIIENYSGTLSTGETIEYSFSTPLEFTSSGVFNLKTWSSIPNDDVFFNDTIRRTIFASIGDLAIPNPEYKQDFEGDNFPPDDWFVTNFDQEFSWEQVSEIVGSNGEETKAVLMRNRIYGNEGARDELFSIPVDLTNISDPILTFDVSYVPLSASCSDTLIVEIYTECGDVFEGEVYRKAGDELTVDGILADTWIPEEATDWREDFVMLNDYVGEQILIKFININDFCNNLYLDNINVSTFTAPTASFSFSPSQVCIGEEVTFVNNSTGALMEHTWDFGPFASVQTSTAPTPAPVFFIFGGDIEVKLTVENPLGSTIFTQTVSVIDDPVSDFDFAPSGNGIQFTNESEETNTYLWDFGDNTTSTEENPFKEYSTPGSYDVKLTAGNECAEDFRTRTLNVSSTSVKDLDQQVQIEILPNPNVGNFYLQIEDITTRDLEIEIIDVQGRQFGQWQTQSTNGISLFPIKKEGWTAGLYFVKIKDESSVRMLKMTVL